jgi:hypothetical protein
VKTTLAVVLACAGILCAQDGGEKVNVPLSDPSQPARIHVSLLMGGIIVRGGNTREVVVETRSGSGSSHERPVPPKAAGMHRLDVGAGAGLDIVQQNNLVTIKTTPWGRPTELVITVPRNSSLQLKTIGGGGVIDVQGVDGEIDANSLNGQITLNDVSGSILAHALNGEILAKLDRVDPTKPMAFSTLNGDIDVTLPGSIRANLRMKTDHGEIFSDFDVAQIAGSPIVSEDSGHEHGDRHRIRVDNTLRGTINGGGPEYQFTTLNGQIYIRKRK